MRSIPSLGLGIIASITAFISLTVIDAETTIVILEFGPGGSIHRATAAAADGETSSFPTAAVVSLWEFMHSNQQSSSSPNRHLSLLADMSVVPDLFTKADSGIIVGIQSDKSLKSIMPTTVRTLMDVEDAATLDMNVVGHIHISGKAGLEEIMNAADSSSLSLSKRGLERIVMDETFGTRLQSMAKTAARGEQQQQQELGGIEMLFVNLENDEQMEKSAAIADEQLGRMLQTLKDEAAANGKTVILHLVIEEKSSPSAHRRLEDVANNADAESDSNNNSGNSQKTMYEIQSFNLYLWTSVGLFVVVSMVMSAFIAMPLMPDTLLFGETAKIGSD